MEVDTRSSRQDPGIGCYEQGLEAARLQIRGQHHLLRLHASGGHGERSPGRVFPASTNTGYAKAGNFGNEVGKAANFAACRALYLPNAACAAARRAIGTRNGLQLT